MNKINLFLVSVVLVFSAACNKDAQLIDNSTNNNELGFKTIDSIKVKTSTVLDDVVDGTNLTNVLLGASSDSRFGDAKAAFYTEFSLSQNSYDVGENPILDSIVLVLDQSEQYGSLNANFDLKVYELDHTLDADIEYENNTVLNLKSSALASYSSFKFPAVAKPIRIRLNDSFGNALLSQFGTSVFESSANFKDYFKGVYVTATSLNGDGFSTLALKNDNTKLQLYYHSDSQTDTSYSFVIESSDLVISQYNNNSTGSEAALAVADNNIDEAYSYVSSMSSFKTLVSFPDLSTLQNVIINKAELTFYQADYSSSINSSLPEMETLFLFAINSDASIGFLPDFSLSNPSAFGGTKELVEINGQNTYQYTFNISDYIQDLINGTADGEELYLVNISNNQGGRIKIGGGANTSLPVKLELLFTEKK